MWLSSAFKKALTALTGLLLWTVHEKISVWRSELSALVRIFIAASLDVSEQRQTSTEQSCDDSRARSVDSRCCYRCLTRGQPL